MGYLLKNSAARTSKLGLPAKAPAFGLGWEEWQRAFLAWRQELRIPQLRPSGRRDAMSQKSVWQERRGCSGT